MTKRKIKTRSQNKSPIGQYIIGIDEVGRGALAGPVVVAALAITTKFKINPSGIFRKQNSELGIKKKTKNSAFLILNSKLAKLRDSKKLSPRQREIWFRFIKKHPKIFYAVASIPPSVIDKINISRAANLAATRALNKLLATSHLVLATRENIFLDGGLYLDKKTLLANGYWLKPKTIIRGDEKIPAISLASIVAKVIRDRYMKKLHKKYPRYDFIHNVGYGVKKHITAVKKFGRSPVHRKSFKIHRKEH
ncbi:ribonuclease HII [Candidatus Wolfebacteria bacterium]|nr:ribonuclease HII [Candidatus Wolfebacteria bacterium]